MVPPMVPRRLVAMAPVRDRGVPTETARRVLGAVAEALPDGEPSFVAGLEMAKAWSGEVRVRLRTDQPRSPQTQRHWLALRVAVEDALVGHRHRVEMSWGSR